MRGEHRLGVGTGHEAGDHHVHPDPVDPDFACQRLRGDGERALRRRVRTLTGVHRPHRERRHDDDRTAPGAPHLRDRGAAQLERTEHVDLPRLLPVGEVGVHDRVVGRTLRRAAHDDVDPAEDVDRPLHEPSALGDVAGVGRHREPLHADRLQLDDDLVEVLGPPGRDHDVAAVAREGERGGTADPGTDPGDHREPPVAAHGRAAPKSSAMRPSRRASSVSSSARQPASASAAASTDAARNRR